MLGNGLSCWWLKCRDLFSATSKKPLTHICLLSTEELRRSWDMKPLKSSWFAKISKIHKVPHFPLRFDIHKVWGKIHIQSRQRRWERPSFSSPFRQLIAYRCMYRLYLFGTPLTFPSKNVQNWLATNQYGSIIKQTWSNLIPAFIAKITHLAKVYSTTDKIHRKKSGGDWHTMMYRRWELLRTDDPVRFLW